MNVPTWLWVTTVGLLVGLLTIDVFVIGRRPHEPSLRESALAIGFYVALALLFGCGVLVTSGAEHAGEFYAGWLTEYSLSIDNLFVFTIIMGRLRVPRHLQQTALLIGIILALLMRAVFIALGAAAIREFSWVFYVFGAFLVVTALRLALHRDDDEAGQSDNAAVRYVKRRLPATEDYHGVKLLVHEQGTRRITPMLVVVVALGTTDLLFALDSIPAIYGLTEEPYLVFAANVFALMGLRQLYFLVGGLLERLRHLSVGLSIVLGFIGVKLVLHALHENEVPFINDGQHVGVPEIPTWLSLAVILGTLGFTTATSLMATRRVKPPRTSV